MEATATQREWPSEAAGTLDIWFEADVWCLEHATDTAVNVGSVAGLVCTSAATHLQKLLIRDATRPHDVHPITARHIAGIHRHDIAVDMEPSAIRARRLPMKIVMVAEDPTWWAELDIRVPPRWLRSDQSLRLAAVVPELRDGEILVRAHAAVYVDTHHVGRLDGVRVDSAANRLLAAIVEIGHRWHRRQVLVPAAELVELTETFLRARGPREHIRQLPTVAERGVADDLTPVEPHEVGIDDREPDTAHLEAAHLLADQTHELLKRTGFQRQRDPALGGRVRRPRGSRRRRRVHRLDRGQREGHTAR